MQVNSIDYIRKQLTEKLSPTQIEVIDDSALHVGHVGAKGGGHYTVRIAAPAFEGKSLVESHRLVYQALGDVVGHEIHALRIQILK